MGCQMHVGSGAYIRVESGGAALAASLDERIRLRGAGAGRLHRFVRIVLINERRKPLSCLIYSHVASE
jgi:hypothetical protein